MHAVSAPPRSEPRRRNPARLEDLPGVGELLAQAQSENFPVAAVVLGRRRRAHLMALYGFARLVDDVGDEAGGDRLALLDLIEDEVDRIYAGRPPEHPVMRALAGTVADCRLPAGPFRRLIEANRLDQTVARYETFEDLLGYCRLSATPVGELVLGIFGAASAERIARSDEICAALQIAEHLQDQAEDLARGRVYLPQEDLRRFDCAESDLAAAPDRRRAAHEALVRFEVSRAAAMLRRGAPLAVSLPPAPRLAVAAFVAGGRSALAGVVRGGGPQARPRGPLVRGLLAALVGR
jgi:squalene synthase HpnC